MPAGTIAAKGEVPRTHHSVHCIAGAQRGTANRFQSILHDAATKAM